VPPGVDNWFKWNIFDFPSAVFYMPRSIFSNIFSRRLPRWGRVNEKIAIKDLKLWTPVNILAFNAFAHHDMYYLPMGLNQTIVTETLDVVDDLTSRLPKIWG